MITRNENHPMTTVQEKAQALTEFDAGQAVRAGIGAGSVLGIVVGGTLWTHTPDIIHLGVALGIILFCAIMGALIGKLVASIQPEID